MNILFVATEARGLVSIGGIAEVVVALAHALRQSGHDVRIAMPYYAYVNTHKQVPPGMSPIWQGDLRLGALPQAAVYQTHIAYKNERLPLYLVKGHPWFDQARTRDDIYCPDSDPVYPEPYAFFPAAILRFLESHHGDWLPTVIHCHDYHAGLLPVYLNTVFGGRIVGQPIRTVFTIHNLAFQGRAPRSALEHAGLPPELGDFSPGLSGMEFYGQINIMKGAICYSDATTTVSESYAQEIQTPQHGKGLDGILAEAARQGRLKGIVNGIDNDTWNPELLGNGLAYSANDLTGKDRAKGELRRVFGLAESSDPIIAVRSRWSYQKGIELVLRALRDYNLHHCAQIAVAGWGKTGDDPTYLRLWYEMIGWAQSFPQRIAFKRTPGTDMPATELHYAGSDMFLMPSLFEPCGLGQMEAMRYGTIPIVHRTGGLRDTVKDGWGFGFDWSFEEPLDERQKQDGVQRLMAALDQALDTYRDKEAWQRMMIAAMTQDNDWASRAPQYEQLYRADA